LHLDNRFGRRRFAVIFTVFVFLCGALAFSTQISAQQASASATVQTPEASALWIDVPFVKQPPEGCGAASISMLLQYWSEKTGHTYPVSSDVDKIQSALYSKREKGISGSSMQKYFKQAGFDAYPFRGHWEDLSHHVAKGRPLIVGLAASGAERPLHFVVVVGVDDAQGYVYVNDPAQQKLLRLSRQNFLSEWDVTGDWTLLAVPAG
jgi:ABC-type bacteriocin/lantibiotic exporter with double-glycine peptidase domain